MKLVSCLLLLMCATSLQTAEIRFDLENEWQSFKNVHGKTYSDFREEKYRKMIFMENSKTIARHNRRYLEGLSSFEMGMNQFGDMLHHEFVEKMMGLLPNYDEVRTNGSAFLSPENVEIPKSINWVVKGLVTDVKNQEDCGSCWSFSATGALEGQHKKKTGKLVSLSEQNLVDCSSKYGNNGCDGGLPDYAFKYIKANKGVDTEQTYPYEAAQGECRFKRRTVGATATGFVDIKRGSENQLVKAVGTVGPLAAGIDACQPSFQFYKEGIYDEPDCSETEICHAVLIVGYGKLKGDDFWLIKNSWGPTWGKKGYIRMSKGKKNQCGIATLASYPLV